MSAKRSPATGRHHPLTQVCAVYRVPRSTVYAAAARTTAAPESSGAKQGPKTPASDDTLVAAMRAVLAATPFLARAIARCDRASARAIGCVVTACYG